MSDRSLSTSSSNTDANFPKGICTQAQIPGTALWVEANQSAQSVMRVIGKLLAVLGHTAGEFEVTL